MVIDQYCSGEDLLELTLRCSEAESDIKATQQTLLEFINQIYDIIRSFHRQDTFLGNLNLSSFQLTSPISQEVRLVDFNFTGDVSEHQKMGFAHRNNFEADFEFFDRTGLKSDLELLKRTALF